MGKSNAIDVQLRRPFSVAAQPASRLAVWLLAALAVRAGADRAASRVGAAELAAQLESAAALPMSITRLFTLYRAVPLDVGWGADASFSPDTLSLRGRSSGPFWLPQRTL